ncbi:hypothetical protein SAMD00019534_066280 [Acytostelium subglobosum LB1]|uniref:hypothetical protein n=1 Tax=Acytostelium subglobosum LB1 TaxID=1410327 RepID=UPI000644CA63|nr:hypothetical protein SAMD00019534_066280 [Acytostelium subglobosum LB1]GAM23453.1 hypothetical protein SAMD00019534_066280 [Acytostelium subglobosum LB1]|eukprot:XP_012753902.1 hypothetical protein SAMD00019534_066280 [Acytostelium subglobosum LB1]
MTQQVIEVFKQSVMGEAASTSHHSTLVKLDRLFNASNYQVNGFAHALLHPVKIFLCCQSSSKDEHANQTCRLISKYIYHLATAATTSTSTSTSTTTTTTTQTSTSSSNTRKLQLKNELLKFIFNCTDSKENVVRLRSLQILSQLLNLSPTDKLSIFKLSDGIIGNNNKNSLTLQSILSSRCKDKNSSIRLLATNMSIKLYSHVKDVFKFEELMAMMNEDTMYNIRSAIMADIIALGTMNKCERSEMLNAIIMRTKDVKDTVRIQSFNMLKQSFQFEELTRDQAIAVLTNGFGDSLDSVQQATSELLRHWFRAMENNTLYRFLELIDVERNETLLERWLLKVYERSELSEFSLKGRESLDVTCEEAFHFKLTVKQLQQKKEAASLDDKYYYEDCLEGVLPTLTEYRDVLFHHINEPFILKQLLQVLAIMDQSDEVGRSNILTFLIEFLKRINDQDLLKQTLSCLSILHSVERDFIVMIVELLSDMIDPLEDDPLKVRLTVLEKTLKKLGNKSPGESKKIQSAIDTLKEDIKNKETETLTKCSFIAHYLLLNSKKCSNSPEIDGLLQLIILPSIQHPMPELRKIGIQNLGIFCLHRKVVAFAYLNLFEKIIENDTREIHLVALKVIFDILLVFGSPDKLAKELLPLLKIIRKFSQSSNDLEIKTICIEGFVKLLYSGIVKDPKIVVFLFLELFSTSTKELLELRKCLYLFFQSYIADCLDNKRVLFENSMTILQSITQANTISSYASINITELARFLLFLLDKTPSTNGNANDSPQKKQINDEKNNNTSIFNPDIVHPTLAKLICHELISSFRGATTELTKVLPLLKFDRERHQDYLLELKDLVEKVSLLYSDANIEKFHHMVNSQLPTHLRNAYISQTSGRQTQSGVPSFFTITEHPAVDSTSKTSSSTSSKLGNGKSKNDTNIKLPTGSQLIPKSHKKIEFNHSLIQSFFDKQKEFFNTVEHIDKTPIVKSPKKKQKTTTTSTTKSIPIDNMVTVSNIISDKQQQQSIQQQLSKLNVHNQSPPSPPVPPTPPMVVAPNDVDVVVAPTTTTSTVTTTTTTHKPSILKKRVQQDLQLEPQPNKQKRVRFLSNEVVQ